MRGFGTVSARSDPPLLEEIVVVDNNSKDRTTEIAREAGATVVFEPEYGYGRACLRGMRHLRERPAGPPDVVVFADGDASNDPEDLPELLAPILDHRAELVIGSRTQRSDAGSLTLPQRFGTQLACTLMGVVYNSEFTDLGPFRAISWRALESLEMSDPTYGWTIEMQIKAEKAALVSLEVQVQNHARLSGRSKVSGTVRGVVGAGTKILGALIKYY